MLKRVEEHSRDVEKVLSEAKRLMDLKERKIQILPYLPDSVSLKLMGLLLDRINVLTTGKRTEVIACLQNLLEMPTLAEGIRKQIQECIKQEPSGSRTYRNLNEKLDRLEAYLGDSGRKQAGQEDAELLTLIGEIMGVRLEEISALESQELKMRIERTGALAAASHYPSIINTLSAILTQLMMKQRLGSSA